MHVLVERREAVAQGALVAAQFAEFLVLLRAVGFGGGQRDAGLGHRAVGGIQNCGQGGEHVLRRIDLVLTQHGEPRRLLGGRPLGFELAFERVGLRMLGADPLASGLQVDARLQLGGPGILELEQQGITRRDIQDGARLRGVRVALRGGVLDRGIGLLDGFRQCANRLREPLALCRGRLQGDAGAPEGFAPLGQSAVELLQCRDRLRRIDLRQIEGLALLGERESLPFDRGRDLHEPLLRGIPFCDQFELAAPRAGTAAQHVLGEHIALTRDDGEVVPPGN